MIKAHCTYRSQWISWTGFGLGFMNIQKRN